MISQGVSLRTVSDGLGHANIRITSDTYVEVLDELKVEAARQMDDLFQSSTADELAGGADQAVGRG